MSRIRYLLFDLDDTLYNDATRLFDEVGERIEGWMVEALGLSTEEAVALRQRYLRDYGTTMAGILLDFPDADIDDYLDYIHGVDAALYLRRDPMLEEMLGRLPVPKVVFTSSITPWAERVLDLLGVREHFEAIVDVRTVNLLGKPRPEAYQQLLEILNVPGEACVFLDDSPKNLRGAAQFGMHTILVREGGEAGEGIDYVVDTVHEAEPILQRLLGREA
jgi:putative hydrolase of the HAD superfamily